MLKAGQDLRDTKLSKLSITVSKAWLGWSELSLLVKKLMKTVNIVKTVRPTHPSLMLRSNLSFRQPDGVHAPAVVDTMSESRSGRLGGTPTNSVNRKV